MKQQTKEDINNRLTAIKFELEANEQRRINLEDERYDLQYKLVGLEVGHTKENSITSENFTPQEYYMACRMLAPLVGYSPLYMVSLPYAMKCYINKVDALDCCFSSSIDRREFDFNIDSNDERIIELCNEVVPFMKTTDRVLKFTNQYKRKQL